MIEMLLIAMAACAAGAAPDSTARQLEEVVVSARRPGTRAEGSTLISTIAGTELERVGTAADVLAQLPMLSVTDGEVSVTGRGAPEIFIDGRPQRDSDELSRLRSDNIGKVELDLAPGAMYDSSVRAVLRITTRRNFADGLSLTDRAEVTVRRRVSAGNYLDINYRLDRAWDVFADVTAAYYDSRTKGSTINTLIYDGKPTTVGGSQDNRYPTRNFPVSAGFNYAGHAGSAGGYYRYNTERGDFSNSGTEWLDDSAPLTRLISRHTKAGTHHAAAYYDHTEEGGMSVHADATYRHARSSGNDVTAYPGGEAPDVRSEQARHSTLWAAKAYVTMPAWGGRLTAGIQDSYTRTALDHVMLSDEVASYLPSASNVARQVSAAAYAKWRRTAGPLDIDAGVRYQYVDYSMTTDGRRDDGASRRRHLVSPDVSLTWTPRPQASLALSYRLATVRPPYAQLTSAPVYTGRHEMEGGNPGLRDEHMHQVSLTGMWGDFVAQADFTRSLDTYAYVKEIYPADGLQLLMHPVNIDVTAVSLYLMWGRKIGIWRPEATAGLYRQWLALGGRRYDEPILTYSLQNMLTLPGGVLLTVNATGQTSGDMHTNRFGTTGCNLSASVSREFPRTGLSVKVGATDILNSRNNSWTMDTYGIHTDKRQSYDRRGVSLTVTYRFNPVKSKYKGGEADESEMQRL